MRATKSRRTAARTALLVAVLAVPVLPAVAQPATDVRLQVLRGYDGYVRAHTPNPTAVTIEADRLFSGRIEVRQPSPIGGGETAYEAAVDVPGGSRKVVLIMGPRATVNEVRAVDADGTQRANVRTPGATDLQTGEPLIGVLSGDAPPATVATMPVTGQRAAVVTVPREYLELGPAALAPLSHLVVDGAVGRQLTDPEGQTLRGYVLEGGELIVAADRAGDAAFLPPRWVSRADVRRETGAGGVTIVAGGLDGGGWGEEGPMWARTLRPVDAFRWSAGHPSRQSALMSGLRDTSGFRRPPLGWLLGFLVLYVALAGPVTFFVLARMGRRELAWVAVPALAVLFAAGAFVAGRNVRTGPPRQGVAVVALAQDGVRIDALVATMSDGSGETTIEAARALSVEPVGTTYGGGAGEGRVRRTPDSLVTAVRLGLGDVGTVHVRAVRHDTSPPAGEALWTSNGVEATVRNTSPYRLIAPVLVAGRTAKRIGNDLAPGAAATERLAPASPRRGLAALHQAALEARSLSGEEYAPFTAPIPAWRTFSYGDGGLVEAAATAAGVGLPGSAYLVGWARLDAVLGDEIPGAVGPALVALPLAIRAEDGAVPADAVTSTLVAHDGQVGQSYSGYPPTFDQVRESVVRFRLPQGARPERLSLSIDRSAGSRAAMFSSSGGPGGGGVSVRFWLPRARTWSEPRTMTGTSVGVPAEDVLGPGGEVYARVRTGAQATVIAGLYTLRGTAG